MNDLPALALSLATGVLLGSFFFAGLWWTVQKGVVSEWPALWFLLSLLVRTLVILGGFYLVSQGHWSRLVVCLLGFLIARFVVVKRFMRGPTGGLTHLEKETGVAP